MPHITHRPTLSLSIYLPPPPPLIISIFISPSVYPSYSLYYHCLFPFLFQILSLPTSDSIFFSLRLSLFHPLSLYLSRSLPFSILFGLRLSQAFPPSLFLSRSKVPHCLDLYRHRTKVKFVYNEPDEITYTATFTNDVTY